MMGDGILLRHAAISRSLDSVKEKFSTYLDGIVRWFLFELTPIG